MMEAFTNQPLPVGGMIQEFRILQVLGAGSFGIVYYCENTSLPEEAAIKEFLPMDVAGRLPNGEVRPLSDASEEGFLWARDRFLQEAKTLWNLGHPNPHRNIVRVTRFCEANGTAYMFMAFERGRPLSALLEERDTLPYAELKKIIFPPSRPSTRPAPWTSTAARNPLPSGGACWSRDRMKPG
jgi:serine/threonine protein kinase